MLKKIPMTLKRLLNRSYRTLYKRGKVNGDLALTMEGERSFVNYLLTQNGNAKAFAEWVEMEHAKDEDEDEDKEDKGVTE